MPVVFYENLGDFAASLPERVTKTTGYLNERKYAVARKDLWRGDPAALAASEKLLEQLEGDGIALMGPMWENDRVGMLPCVPSYLAGDPDSMRRLTETPLETTPVKIFVDACVSAGFTNEHLQKRGVAILALVRKLTMVRPTELWVYSGMDQKRSEVKATIPVIRIDTAPLDLTTVSYVLGNAEFLRQLCFAWGYDGREFSGGFAFNRVPDSARANLVAALGVGDQDMLINGMHLSDLYMRDPLQWVNDQVKRYATTVQDYAC